MRKWIEIFIFSLILLPLSVDNILSIRVGDYHLRVQYFGAFLAWGLLAEHVLLRKKVDFQLFLSDLKRWAFPFFVLFWLVGLIGITQSTLPSRAVSFLAWNIFTVLSVFAITWFYGIVKKYPLKEILFHYVSAQSVLIIIDSLLCIPSYGKWHLGRVMIYGGPGGLNLCRPHAFYQEPGYFCAFALLVLAVFFTKKEIQKREWAQVAITSLAVFLTTSRMGWLGLFVLFVTQKGFRDSLITFVKKSGIAVKSALAIVAVAFAFFAGPIIYEQVGKGLINPTQDGSFKSRFKRTEKAMMVFKHSPWVGVGPGSAGAYYVDHFQGDEWLVWLESQNPGSTEKTRRDPLSQNMYSEVLSEWGFFGFALFILGLFTIIQSGATRSAQFTNFATLLIIYSSTQTLARFDLWICLATLFSTRAAYDTKRA